MGNFHPPDHAAGDANTVGGYRAVHSRPAAFEGKDNAAYSVEIVADEVRDPRGWYGSYLLFVRWRHGDPVASAHLETDYLAFDDNADVSRTKLGATLLSNAKRLLDELIDRERGSSRPWYEAMKDA
ncbi:MAG: hypothetical protein ACR2MQ_02565 [Gemmatimonadaceae bacterium]